MYIYTNMYSHMYDAELLWLLRLRKIYSHMYNVDKYIITYVSCTFTQIRIHLCIMYMHTNTYTYIYNVEPLRPSWLRSIWVILCGKQLQIVCVRWGGTKRIFWREVLLMHFVSQAKVCFVYVYMHMLTKLYEYMFVHIYACRAYI